MANAATHGRTVDDPIAQTRERDRVRLSLDVSRELDDLLVSLAEATHSTKSDVLRRAIALMKVAVEARQNGENLYVSRQPPEGASREIVGI